jgi:hypothetical protein
MEIIEKHLSKLSDEDRRKLAIRLHTKDKNAEMNSRLLRNNKILLFEKIREVINANPGISINSAYDNVKYVYKYSAQIVHGSCRCCISKPTSDGRHQLDLLMFSNPPKYICNQNKFDTEDTIHQRVDIGSLQSEYDMYLKSIRK